MNSMSNLNRNLSSGWNHNISWMSLPSSGAYLKIPRVHPVDHAPLGKGSVISKKYATPLKGPTAQGNGVQPSLSSTNKMKPDMKFDSPIINSTNNSIMGAVDLLHKDVADIKSTLRDETLWRRTMETKLDVLNVTRKSLNDSTVNSISSFVSDGLNMQDLERSKETSQAVEDIEKEHNDFVIKNLEEQCSELREKLQIHTRESAREAEKSKQQKEQYLTQLREAAEVLLATRKQWKAAEKQVRSMTVNASAHARKLRTEYQRSLVSQLAKAEHINKRREKNISVLKMQIEVEKEKTKSKRHRTGNCQR